MRRKSDDHCVCSLFSCAAPLDLKRNGYRPDVVNMVDALQFKGQMYHLYGH